MINDGLTKSQRYSLRHPERRKAMALASYYRHLKENRRKLRERARIRSGSTRTSRKKSNTYKARRWEKHIAMLLGARDMNAEAFGRPFDLLLGDIRIELKVAEKGTAWLFNTHRPIKCDCFLLLCLRDEELEKAYLLPVSSKNKFGISIGEISEKYDQFKLPLPLSPEYIKSLCHSQF